MRGGQDAETRQGQEIGNGGGREEGSEGSAAEVQGDYIEESVEENEDAAGNNGDTEVADSGNTGGEFDEDLQRNFFPINWN